MIGRHARRVGSGSKNDGAGAVERCRFETHCPVAIEQDLPEVLVAGFFLSVSAPGMASVAYNLVNAASLASRR